MKISIGDCSQSQLWDRHTYESNKTTTPTKSAIASVQEIVGARVLIVDDGKANRQLIKLILTKAGCIVSEAENGVEGRDAALTQPFDIVLMDMQMPLLDGYEATRQLRKAGYEKPVVALTANAMTGDREKCLAAGCSSFLAKPIDIDNLVANVRSSFIGETTEQSSTITTAPEAK